MLSEFFRIGSEKVFTVMLQWTEYAGKAAEGCRSPRRWRDKARSVPELFGTGVRQRGFAQEVREAGEVVGVDEVNAGVAEGFPDGLGVGGAPEAELAVLGVGLVGEGFQFRGFVRGDGEELVVRSWSWPSRAA